MALTVLRHIYMAQFSLLTINCFGVPAPQTRRRLHTLADQLNRDPLTVVCFQEVQMHTYRRLLLDACTRYEWSACQPFFHAPKGGLLTLSQQRITQKEFTLYSARGNWHGPSIADRLLHKGMLYTSLCVEGIPIIVINTHLNANYRGDWDNLNQYTLSEQQQLRQLADCVNRQPSDAIIVVAGDFNIPRHSWLYEEFVEATDLIDPLTDDMRQTVRFPVATFKRYAYPIDFTFVRLPDLPSPKIDSALCFEQKVPLRGGGYTYLSDHLGVRLNISWDSL
jgi:endonuclease/exonuclease/phosphatase family metal-dependent hydrolase